MRSDISITWLGYPFSQISCYLSGRVIFRDKLGLSFHER